MSERFYDHWDSGQCSFLCECESDCDRGNKAHAFNGSILMTICTKDVDYLLNGPNYVPREEL